MAETTRRTGTYPELTWTAVLVGWVIGAVIAVSIAYAALILGFSIEGSELAAILGWGVLRGVMGRTSILENNINQTIASAVNGASAGIMFTVPALFILGRREGMESVADLGWGSILLLILASITGCIIGLAFVIPLRKQMIDFDRLPYPGGIAVATILKSPGAGIRKAMFLLGGALFSGLIHFYVLGFLGTEDWHFGEAMNWPPMLNLVLYLSVMTIGVGFLSGKGGFWFGAGGFICYFLLSPILSMIGDDEIQPYVRGADYVQAGQVLPEGRTVTGAIEEVVLTVSAATADDAEATKTVNVRLGESDFGAYDKTPTGSTITVNGTEGQFTSIYRGFSVDGTDGETKVSRGDFGPGAMRGLLYRPTGIGMLIGAALGGIFAAFPLIFSALRSMSKSRKGGDEEQMKSDEMPISLLYSAIVVGAIALVGIAYMSATAMPFWRAALMALLGTLWIWVAGIIVSECVGRTNWSPLSGMTLIAVTIVVLIAKDGVADKPTAIFSSIVVGAAICLAVSQASDMMLDLKSGYLVGATPRSQQFAQFIGAWLGPIIVIFLMIVLNRTSGIGSEELPAPQATALASVMD